MGYSLAPVTNSIPNLWINYSFTKKIQMALYLIITYYWLAVYLPLWKIWVSWDYDIPNWMEKSSSHVPNHQPACFFIGSFWIYSSLTPATNHLHICLVIYIYIHKITDSSWMIPSINQPIGKTTNPSWSSACVAADVIVQAYGVRLRCLHLRCEERA